MMLGVHLYEEMADYAGAAPHILRASTMENAPLYLSSLGIRLLSEEGSLINALEAAVDLIKTSTNPVTIGRLALRIRSLNYNFQKSQWKQALAEYKKLHKKNPTGLSEIRPYLQNSPRAISSVLTTESSSLPKLVKELMKERFSFRYSDNSKEIEAVDEEQEKLLGNAGVNLDVSAFRKGKPK